MLLCGMHQDLSSHVSQKKQLTITQDLTDIHFISLSFFLILLKVSVEGWIQETVTRKASSSNESKRMHSAEKTKNLEASIKSMLCQDVLYLLLQHALGVL